MLSWGSVCIGMRRTGGTTNPGRSQQSVRRNVGPPVARDCHRGVEGRRQEREDLVALVHTAADEELGVGCMRLS